MLFLQSVRLAADRPHVWVSGAGWSWDWLWDWLWPNACAAWSGFPAWKSVWKQISTQVALTARTCQWGMLNASANKTRQTSPTSCSSLIYTVHSFTPFFQSRSFSSVGSRSFPSAPLGRSKSLRRSVTRLSLSLTFCLCVCSNWEMGCPPIFAKQTCTHTQRESRQCQSISVRYRQYRLWIPS